MITIKTDREIELMYKAGQVAAEALALGGENVKPGVTTRSEEPSCRERV